MKCAYYVVYKQPNQVQVLRKYILKSCVDCNSWQYFPGITLIAWLYRSHTAISAFLFTNSANSALVSTVVTFFDAILVSFIVFSNLHGCQPQETNTVGDWAKDISRYLMYIVVRGKHRVSL
jgi:hypothetical protein